MLDNDTKTKLKTMSLLYVEDEDELRATMLYTLERKFSKVYVGKNGQEGLELFKQYKPDFIITDIKMPVLDGLGMIKNIRKVDRNTPILILSAYDDKKYLMEAIDYNVTKYIVKPITNSTLLPALNELFQEKELKIQYAPNLFYYPQEHKFEKDGVYTHLTSSEHEILDYMYKNKESVISYEAFTNLLYDASVETIRTHIKNIRKKSDENIIKTIPTLGYKLKILI